MNINSIFIRIGLMVAAMIAYGFKVVDNESSAFSKVSAWITLLITMILISAI